MKIVSIIIFLLLLAAPASAAKVEMMNKDMNVNALVKNGWKLHTVTSSDDFVTYTLIKKNDVITCKVNSRGGIECFKP
tara:strand:- start:1290 stop:1523 length:234 start_codon:yes stop_codon:yes gene_type:complete